MDPHGAVLSSSQRHVLETLKRHGEATADELAGSLGISPSAVRQHLGSLRSAGLVSARRERGHAGRPADRYHATAASETIFASEGGDLAVDLLHHLDEEAPELIDRVFQRRRRQLVEDARETLHDLPLEPRLAALADYLDDQGFLADFEQLGDGRFRLNLHSCPVWPVASEYRQACGAELGFIMDLVPDATVQRVTHKTSGAHTCTYEIGGVDDRGGDDLRSANEIPVVLRDAEV